jgi:hypothetical protein
LVGTPEIIVPFPATIAPLVQVRTTLLIASQDALRAAGLFEAYVAATGSHRSELLSLYAGSWKGVDVATAHYEACDRLRLPAAKILELGKSVSAVTHSILASTALRMAREAGVTPWFYFRQADRFWARAWDGSALFVEQIGPKDVHVKIAGMPLACIPYFRLAFAGFATAIAEFTSRKAFARHVPGECTETALGYHVAWA